MKLSKIYSTGRLINFEVKYDDDVVFAVFNSENQTLFVIFGSKSRVVNVELFEDLMSSITVAYYILKGKSNEKY